MLRFKSDFLISVRAIVVGVIVPMLVLRHCVAQIHVITIGTTILTLIFGVQLLLGSLQDVSELVFPCWKLGCWTVVLTVVVFCDARQNFLAGTFT